MSDPGITPETGGSIAPAGPASVAVMRNVVRVYVGLVALAGLGLSAFVLLRGVGDDLIALTVFCLAAALAEVVKSAVSDDTPVAVSLSLAVVLAAIVVFGPGGAVVTAVCAALAAGLLHRPRPRAQKTIFNTGLFAIEAAVAGLAYQAVGGHLGRTAPSARDALACVAALAAYFAVTWPLLIGILHLTTHRSLRSLWDDLRWMAAQIGVSATIGFTLGTAYLLFGWPGAAIYVAPLLAVRGAMRQYTRRVGNQLDELRRAHAEADAANQALVRLNQTLDLTNEGLLNTLASVIDARDIYLYGHSVQASKYAGAVARIMGLSEEQVRIAELGALLHDLGKIGVSEAILNKPARLTEEEYEEIKAHCEIGYQLLANLPHFEEVADIVYSHHEHYDGTGYPRRLKGEAIHIGARIVSVVEATEAMVSDRPYRRGMTPDEVLRELAEGAGSQWDPEVVRIFSAMLSSDRKHLSMRNSALEIALSRTPIGQLVERSDTTALEGVSATFHGATQPILILDQDCAVVAANPAAERLTGFSEAQLQEQHWSELTGSAELRPESGSTFFSSTRSVQFRQSTGPAIALEVTGSQLRTNSAAYWVVVANPLRQRTPVEAALGGDVLTGLAGFEEFRLETEMAIDNQVEPLTVALLNVDGLGAINETFGKEVGDQALRTLAETVRVQLRQGDLAARLEADTFAVLMRRASLIDAGRALQRVEDDLPEAGAAVDLDCVIEFCSGAAQWNGRESFEELVARARLWLEAEKRSRRPGGVVALPITRARRRPSGPAVENVGNGLG